MNTQMDTPGAARGTHHGGTRLHGESVGRQGLGRRGALVLGGSLTVGVLATLAGCGRFGGSSTPEATVATTASPRPSTPAEPTSGQSIEIGSARPSTHSSGTASPGATSGTPDPSHAPSTQPATSSTPEKPRPSASQEPVTPGKVTPGLRPGAKGAEVVVLQKRLNELKFWVGKEDGDFGLMTRQGVAAAQKAAGIAIDAYVGPITTKALNAGIALTPRSSSGHALEVDKARQLLLVVDNGRVTRYYNTSTGGGYEYYNKGTGKTEKADTPAGTFKVFREVEGWDPGPLGAIYRPMYFNGGIAVHGTNADVLDRPKSHGCVRLTLPMMDEIRRSGQIDIGTTVLVY